jgi:undecaprenyl diphosphate synthase
MLAEEVKEGDLEPENIDESLISAKTYTVGVPDPDLIIRTSGELRLSNFLIWQSVYAEYFFTDVLWPDFTKENLHEALFEYQQRKRRMGGATVSRADSKFSADIPLPANNTKKSKISETSA